MNERAKINLYNVDCIEFMKDIPNNYYDLAVVDPPYGIDVANMNMGAGNGKKSSKLKNRKWRPKKWDNETPNNEYFEELFRVSKNQIIWGGNYFDLPISKNFIIWDKCIDINLSFSMCEMAWTNCKGTAKIFKHSVYIESIDNKIHPTQKPVALYKWILMNYAKQGDKKLDTHFGNLSIGLACWDLGFDLDACELDKDYFDAATKRLEQHKAQLKLF